MYTGHVRLVIFHTCKADQLLCRSTSYTSYIFSLELIGLRVLLTVYKVFIPNAPQSLKMASKIFLGFFAVNLEKQLQGVLDNLLQLPNPLGADSAINNLVVKAASDSNLLIPLNTA